MLAPLLLVALAISLASAQAVTQPIYVDPLHNCTFSYNGSNYDFSSLISKSGGLQWQQTWNGTAYTIQLQLCGNVASPAAGCNSASAANFITSAGCISGGQGSVMSWDPNPYNDGFFLSYYHGTYANHVQSYGVHVYMMCDSKPGVPTLEHFTSYYQAHFSWNTPLACAPSKK